MTRPFDHATRRNIAERCAAFARLPASEPALALKPAAVAIALTEADDAAGGTAVLLTLRAAGLRAHSSQWALPGGRCDEGETQVTAALRELHEELGLDLREQNVLGLLDDYPTRSGYLITPVVVWADAFDFTTIPESTRRVIRFRHAGQFIHAPTAALIYQFREVLAGRETRVAELEQPVFAWK